MARYTGPTCKLARRAGSDLLLKGRGRSLETKCKLDTPPGQHGARRKKPSVFGSQLAAKQTLKGYYGNISEKQFRKLYDEAVRRRGDTSENLIELLERRLDAVIYRLKFAPTPFAARQIVNHGHVRVNGKRVNIASYQCKAGDVINLREKAKKQTRVQAALTIAAQVGFPDWVEVDDKKMSGVLKSVPDRQEILPDINESLVVELYSK